MLHTLPTEILDQILINLDIPSLQETKYLYNKDIQIHSRWLLESTESSTLDDAIKHLNLKNIMWLFNQGIKLNPYIESGAIKHVLKECDYEIVEYLIQKKVRFLVHQCFSVFYNRDHKKVCKIMKLLLDNKVNVFSEISYCEATARNNLDAIKLLYDFNIKISDYAIALAARNNNFEIVKWLIQHDARLSDSAICEAAGHGHLEMVKFLQTQGLRVTKYALMNAIHSRNLQIIKYIKDSLGSRDFIDLEDLDFILTQSDPKILTWVIENYDISFIVSQDSSKAKKIKRKLLRRGIKFCRTDVGENILIRKFKKRRIN